MQRNRLLQYIVGFTAIAGASVAAYFSIFGLIYAFAGATTAVLIMGAVLELSKIVSVTYLYRCWQTIEIQWKFIMCGGIFVLIVLTSAGIYGFLSNAYQKTSTGLNEAKARIELVQEKEKIFVVYARKKLNERTSK